MQESDLKSVMDSINNLTSTMHDMDSVSILIKDTKTGEFARISLTHGTVVQEIKLVQRSEIIVRTPLSPNSEP